MRLNSKLFISTFLLFEVVLVTAGVALIEHSFRQSLASEIAAGLVEHSAVESGLTLSGAAVSRVAPLDSEFFTRFLGASFQNYVTESEREDAQVSVVDPNGNEVYSTIGVALPTRRDELVGLHSGVKRYVVREVDGTVYLMSASLLTINDAVYTLTYVRDLSTAYEFRAAQYQALVIINLSLSLLLGGGLLVVLRLLTKPIERLVVSTSAMAHGDYAGRVPVDARDELGELSDSFNRMAEAVAGTVAELERSNQAQQYFSASLTHEIRTPLTSILGYAELLRDAPYSEEQFRVGMGHIYSEAHRLNRIATRLMELIVLQRGNIDRVPVDIAKLYGQVREGLAILASEAHARLEERVASMVVPADKIMIEVVISNLVRNAVRAAGPGGTVRVSIGSDAGGENAIISVEDSGRGIPPELLSRIVEPFFVGDPSRSRAEGGMGLGLAITKTIVDAHGGKLIIDSTPEVGTTATVLLPC